MTGVAVHPYCPACYRPIRLTVPDGTDLSGQIEPVLRAVLLHVRVGCRGPR